MFHTELWVANAQISGQKSWVSKPSVGENFTSLAFYLPQPFHVAHRETGNEVAMIIIATSLRLLLFVFNKAFAHFSLF